MTSGCRGLLELVPLLKFHDNHCVKCPMCKSSLINNLATRIIGGEKTRIYKCLLCFFSFRCCGKLQRNSLSLKKVLFGNILKKQTESPYRKLEGQKNQTRHYTMANFIVERPLIVKNGNKIKASWYKINA